MNIFISVVSDCISISAFASLVGIPIVVTSFAVECNISEITAGIKNYEAIIKKKKAWSYNVISKLNLIEVLIYKDLIDSYINHDEFVSVNNVLKEYSEIKEETKILKMLWHTLHKNNGNLLSHF